jgi:hypothetical protein
MCGAVWQARRVSIELVVVSDDQTCTLVGFRGAASSRRSETEAWRSEADIWVTNDQSPISLTVLLPTRQAINLRSHYEKRTASSSV